MKWGPDDLDNYLNFYSVSGDGRVTNWTLVKTSIRFSDKYLIHFTKPLTNICKGKGINKYIINKNIWKYLKIFENIWKYLKIFENIWKMAGIFHTSCRSPSPTLWPGTWNAIFFLIYPYFLVTRIMVINKIWKITYISKIFLFIPSPKKHSPAS